MRHFWVPFTLCVEKYVFREIEGPWGLTGQKIRKIILTPAQKTYYIQKQSEKTYKKEKKLLLVLHASAEEMNFWK